jgi:hypothetical protein
VPPDLIRALVWSEAALADIGDAEREPGDDLAWAERRAAEELPRIRRVLQTWRNHATPPAATREAGPLPPEGAEIIPPRELVRELATQWFSEIWAVPALVRVASSDLFVAAKGDAWARAQAATREAGPLPQAEISDKELLELMPQQLRDDFAEAARCCAENVEHVMAAGGFRVLLNTSALAYARAVWDRAVLARWGGAAVPPSAGAEISDAEWCALKDRLWDQHETVGDQGERFMWYAHFDTALDLARKELARWGGAALPVPAADKGEVES